MCSSAKVGSMTVSPGAHLIAHSKKGYDYKSWGIHKQYNARIESLDLYKNYDRVFVEFTAFYEGYALFYLPNVKEMKIGALMNEQGILVVTRPAFNTPIEPYHRRSALVLQDADEFINNGKIIEINYNLLKLAI